MFGISYGELFLIVGAAAALIGPKDLPIIARTAGRLAGRAIGYVQLARGQLENVLHESQASQVHKELKETMQQLEAIRYEIRSISIMNPGPVTRRLMENPEVTSPGSENGVSEKLDGETMSTNTISKVMDYGSKTSVSADLHSQATICDRLAASPALRTGSFNSGGDAEKLDDEVSNFNILPVSAESAGLLPSRKDDVKGSDIVLEAIIEAEVAHNAKNFFSQPQNQIPSE
ncbi:sec-independent protein translocase protein TatB [Macadamia integrifolia]|uniref:sec-independent protein translocase protein TatB n=1 Tax=Macadamia integrifolia TaxID=60698 RepID=UPI001C4FE1FE|nr:sec-independent protein translocase protein TatB [Macadamia integrifolia]XP_042516236.1 sec-independent protein translocase protein TatB [Macadamia integrifolia]XP_042516237.1 sec-independent protein translocase protein TatB [Macadamia integrifolia]